MHIKFNHRKYKNFTKFYEFQIGDEILTVREIINFFENKSFVLEFVSIINNTINYNSYFLECPKMNADTLNDEFEFIIYDAKNKFENKSANFDIFCPYSDNHLSFSMKSYSGNTLIIPNYMKGTPCVNYLNISNFLKNSLDEQIVDLFYLISDNLKKEINSGKTVWLSTHGLGIPWLHIRIDYYPTYYSHKKYVISN